MGAWYKEQIGPLPVGAWVAVVGGGLGIAFWSRRHPAPKAPETIEIPASADLGPTVIRDGALAGVGGEGGGTPSGPPPITTNTDWLRIAGSQLIAHGYDPLLVVRALTKFMASEQLSEQETAVVQLALALIGPPPVPPNAPWENPDPQPVEINDPVSVNPVPTTPPRPYTLPDQILSGGGYVNLTPSQLGSAVNDAVGNRATALQPQHIIGYDGYIYAWVPNPNAADAASQGARLYTEPVPGVFVESQWTIGHAAGLAFATPMYVRVGQAPADDIPSALPVFT